MLIERSLREDRGLFLVVLAEAARRPEYRQFADHDRVAVVPKPVKRSRLLRAVSKLVGQAREDLVACRPGVPEDPPAARTWKGARPRLLLVEDNRVNQRVAELLLTKLGYRVEVVGNGALAVAAIQERAYAAVLMDCQMPVLDGYGATRAIRALGGATSKVPIIAMTAHAMVGDRQKCLDAGMDDYLTKPIQMGEVQRALDAWVADEGV